MKRRLKNEQGSATIEFISMVPLVLLIMMVLWQFLVVGYAVIITQSAVNEAAKIYSVTGDSSEANAGAEKVVQNAKATLKLHKPVEISSLGSRDFKATVTVDMNLKFLPKKVMGVLPPLTFDRTINGRTVE